jgi:uncharacterized iron-regulated membrane protein
MTPRRVRAWSVVHTWTSLVCTAFLLMLCVTGLPIIFHDEIESFLTAEEWQPANPDGPLLSYDDILERALAARPGEVPLYMSFDTDRPVVNVTTGPTPDAGAAEMHFASYDRTSGALVPPASDAGGVLDFLVQLHTDMFLGVPGMLFLGAMTVVFLAALVSGVVLYAPFMRRYEFGMVRTKKSRRATWLDLHNLAGIVTLAWVAVVGVTGIVNTLETPIREAWKTEALADLIAPFEGRPVPEQLSSVSAAIAEAEAAAPGMALQFVAFPGGAYSTDHHYAVFLHGAAPLTERLITPALVNAETGAFEGLREMPWYSKALSLSKPLHFGDYGGLPLKLIWGFLDLATILVLGSGLYLWVAKRAARDRKLTDIRAAGYGHAE